jgi:NAD-dependent DNA ligase
MCPSCNQPVISVSGIHLSCSNEDCSGGFVKQVLHFLKVLGVKDLGEAKIELILDHAGIANIAKLINATTKKEFHHLSTMLKIVLFFGILSIAVIVLNLKYAQ